MLNSLNDAGAGFRHDTNKISIIDRKGRTDYPLKPKISSPGHHQSSGSHPIFEFLIFNSQFLIKYKVLRSLYIQNYALIEKLDISFETGFSVITGETGAGKSIILGAIGLLLGQRADVKAIRHGASKCIIEARFDISAYGMRPFLKKMSWNMMKSAFCVVKCSLPVRAGHSSTILLLRWHK